VRANRAFQRHGVLVAEVHLGHAADLSFFAPDVAVDKLVNCLGF
jgi:hypothetical protein